jgi:GNAT superfamily N-acetyltransferase
MSYKDSSDYVTIEVRAKSNLTRQEKARLNSLTLRSGLLWSYFQDYDNSIIILAIKEEEIVGWGLVFYADEDEDDGNYELHIYVSRYHRRKGIGTKIVEQAIAIFGDLRISKWDEQATSFYENFEQVKEI